MKPASSKTEPIAGSSQLVTSQEGRPMTPLHTLISPTCNDMECTEMTPRKRKLLDKFNRSEEISRKRKRKLVLLQKKIARKERRISSIKAIIDDLQKKKVMDQESLDVILRLGGPQELYSRLNKKSLNKALPKKYSEELKVFALTLHYYSPAAYKYVRRTFNICLPHTRTISRWYQSVNGLPGFTSEAFDALRLKASGSNKIICSLIMDEMAIRQHEEWVPSQGKSFGYVDMGTGSKETTVAKEALVFLLNCVNGNWKIPVGYFLIAGITAEQKRGLVLECLKKCYEAGISVVSLTFDGAPINLTMAKKLGCKLLHTDLKTNFNHPSCEENVVVFLDPSHMIKLVRNTLGEKFSFVNSDNKFIKWEYFVKLNELQEKESFHLANKLRSQHINFQKQKMKVRFATQVFSESVATALQFCAEVLVLDEFKGVGPTVEFTNIMNDLFDILNSRNLLQYNYKKPLTEKNFSGTCEVLDKVDTYISGLKTSQNGALLLDSQRHTGFLGLKVCISSTKLLFQDLVVKKQFLKFLPMYKFSQDNLELFFCSIRAHGGFNNNPTARQFQSAYKKMLMHLEVSESFRGNCIPLEKLNILMCNSVHQINITSKEYSVYGAYLDSQDYCSIENDHDYLPDPMSPFAKNIICYIAGYVVYYLKNKIACEKCTEALSSKTRQHFLYSFIDLKNKNGLEYPSDDLLEICIKCEKILKTEVHISNSILLQPLSSKILKEFVNSRIFSNLVTHSFDQFALDNHRILLIKCIIDKYLNIRIMYLMQNKVSKVSSIRHQSNKIVLFKGQ